MGMTIHIIIIIINKIIFTLSINIFFNSNRILSNVIKEAKGIYYDKKIQKSSNKGKTTWDIIKKLTNNQHSHNNIQELTIYSEHLKDQQDIADAFNYYFLTIIDKTSKNNVNNKTNNEKSSYFSLLTRTKLCSPSPIFSYQDIFNQ